VPENPSASNPALKVVVQKGLTLQMVLYSLALDEDGAKNKLESAALVIIIMKKQLYV